MRDPPPPRVSYLLGVPVHHVTSDEAVAHVEALIERGLPGYVVTVNAAMLGRAARDAAFRRIVTDAALVTPDGMGTLLVGRILGARYAERVAGVDLAERICGMCARRGFRVFFFGAGEGIADEAARRLESRHPGLRVVGTRHGYFTPEDEHDIVETIRAAGAHLLLVALGSPRQEEWLAEHLGETGAVVGIGVGGTLDVYAGRTSLAPAWVRSMGLEWLYRVLREPRRWPVALGLPRVILLAVKERIGRGRAAGAAGLRR